MLDSAVPNPLATGRLSWFVGLLIAAMLATWLPHYLLWPWWPDLDAWATIAQGWDQGIRPYRDVTLFNFPGQIEIAYVLGKLFGWGRTTPVYALDAGLLLGFGCLLWIWSRRRLGRALPGLIAYAAVVSSYTNLDYTGVAQRDWQGPLLAISAILLVQLGRKGTRIAAAAAIAFGFAIRPHVVLFGPAIFLSSWTCGDGDEPARPKWRRVSVLSLATFGFVLLAFSPIIFQGLIPDMIRGVRQASYGSGYNQTSRNSITLGIARELGLPDFGRLISGVAEGWDEIGLRWEGWKTLAILVGLIAVIVRSNREQRRIFLPWLAALIGALLYEPLHPKRHLYLILPLRLVSSCCLAILAQGILGELRKAWLRLVLMALLIAVAMPGVPASCSVDATIAAISSWRQPGEPTQVPLGARSYFRPTQGDAKGDTRSPYTWDDYRRTLAYIRKATNSSTVLANALRGVPFPAINGPVGRVSPFPAESGLIWIWSVDLQAEDVFVENLEATSPGTVVVWNPDEPAFDPRLRLERLRATIRRQFRPEARFGAIQVWRKPVDPPVP